MGSLGSYDLSGPGLGPRNRPLHIEILPTNNFQILILLYQFTITVIIFIFIFLAYWVWFRIQQWYKKTALNLKSVKEGRRGKKSEKFGKIKSNRVPQAERIYPIFSLNFNYIIMWDTFIIRISILIRSFELLALVAKDHGPYCCLTL